ncbi:asparagine synthase (glutamine-hydrolyzing) [Aequorivita sublithincola DSM 14238]|uniref:asparagine synthase (glutamine-hydrolyzing) n=1 Tax=Aequorivita sublithincola (strain DSM 14238 / LMG 21431 / ACAM 643 / 9-3) TaxID=746697 RepID=I3YXI6_AEQSU|nr:asparagine synthase-related protein [Aequorivita sublithincola]AFL81704.1 asparagine synthase (glutamine-hydrolyzing) [Aequorivita sublithincola DSM 14238]
MPTIKTSIIPTHQQFTKVNAPHELDRKAICIFAATGFFLETDTYWKDKKVLPAASENIIDENGFLVESKPWFQWHYSPRDISFETALEEFTALFDQITSEQLKDSKVILPLSGGLDSRTQAVVLAKMKNPVIAYSYSFKGGFSESGIGKKIAKVCGFDFKEFTIDSGYLWPKLEELATINNCYSDFTHPRQMAVLEEFKKMEGVFSLGHWGDVLFDRGAPEGAREEDLLEIIMKKVVKKGGMELAIALWQEWDLNGDFESYLRDRITELLNKITIENPSAKLRAFKSLYWAPRWTSVNLSVFEEAHPVTLPYYDDRMCAFISTVPEEYLADRKLQIAYIKQQNPDLAKITWQEHKPFNLYTFENNKSPNNLPYRIGNKLKREVKNKMGKPYIQRNWELQFLGMENDEKLQEHLFGENIHPFISKPLLAKFYNNFKTVDAIKYSHPLSMLLTLAVWDKSRKNA